MSESQENKNRDNDDISNVPGVFTTLIGEYHSKLGVFIKKTTGVSSKALKVVGALPGAMWNASEAIYYAKKGNNVKAAGSVGSLVGGLLAAALGSGVVGGIALGYLGMKGAEFLADPAEGMRAIGQDYVGPAAKFTTEGLDSVVRPGIEALGGKLQEAGKELSPKIQATMESLGGHIEKGLEPVSVAAKEYVAPAVAKVTTDYVGPAAKAATEKAIGPAAEKLTTGVIGPAAQGIAESVSSAIQNFFSLFKDDPKLAPEDKKGKAGSSTRDAASKVSISASNKISKTTQTKQAETKSPSASQAAQTDLASINSEICVNPELSSETKQSGAVIDKATNDPALVANHDKETTQKQNTPHSQPEQKGQRNNRTRKLSPPLFSPRHRDNQPNEAPSINQSTENKEGETSLLRQNSIAPQLEAEYAAAVGAAPNITFNQQLYFPPGTDREQAKSGVAEANAAAQAQLATTYQRGQAEQSTTFGNYGQA
jgi:hypothetical protein